jgi:DNA-binding transcriptional MerR regulator
MQTGFLSISQVAALLGVRKHRIEYALASGYLPEPKLRFLGKRVFNPAEVLVVAAYFQKDAPVGPCP